MNELQATTKGIEAVEKALMCGDLSQLSPDQRLSYYRQVCDSVGINPLTKPFEYMVLNGKMVLYATKACTEQLRKINKVSLRITAREKIGDVYVVTAQAKLPDGREDESTGALALGRLQGDALANAYMKCETKAKRRVTLSICGLAFLDESEVETIPGATAFSDAPQPQKVSTPPKLSAALAPQDGPSPEPAVVGPEPTTGAFCTACGRELILSASKKGYYCTAFKDKAAGEHSRVPIKDVDAFKAAHPKDSSPAAPPHKEDPDGPNAANEDPESFPNFK